MILLEELPNDDFGYVGWIIAAIGGVVTAITKFLDYQKKRNDNKTTIEISQLDHQKLDYADLKAQNDELLHKFTELEEKFDETDKQFRRALTAFEILLPLLQDLAETHPAIKAALDKASKHFTIKEN